ncbi:MAG: hypothetical protein HKN67_08880 [Saprospiraceae bacterium]|nr:hypothetical protein [Bacteroidia bacterium]MBT8228766.1 hypothetical protein [Bacteroidia bacterium]NNF22043.1 hypothetical protein [Saprospiraceae bacterium]NNK90220.1 hypothetical protein [Saprospiraceae bacterium]
MKKLIRKYAIITCIVMFSIVAFDKNIGKHLLGQMLNSLGENQKIEAVEKKKKVEVEYKIQSDPLNLIQRNISNKA